MEIVERYVKGGLALNVGAVSSATQVLLDRGWRLRVVEVSRHAAETARDRWGLDVTVSRIEDFPQPRDLFDFVKLGHVIEHLADPSRALRTVARIMRPGGVLLIDTDNGEGLRTFVEGVARRLLGEANAAKLVKILTGKNLRNRYGRLIPPIHLHIFSERSLTRLLERTGFEVLELRKPAWGDPVWFPLPAHGHPSLAERTFIGLDKMGAHLGKGELLAVLARRL